MEKPEDHYPDKAERSEIEDKMYTENNQEQYIDPDKLKAAENEMYIEKIADMAKFAQGAEEQIEIKKAQDWVHLFLTRNGQVPRESPLYQYVQVLLNRINDDPDIKLIILDGARDINAFALYSKNIALTKPLLALCETEEELLFLLHHELNHIKKGHLQITPDETDRESYYHRIGIQRIQEVLDADMGSLVDLNERGINIAGAFTFFEKLKGISKGKDLAHGSNIERLIVLKTSLKLKDFEHYDPDTQVPLDENVLTKKNLKDNHGFPLLKEFVDIEEKNKIRTASIETMDLKTLYICYFDLAIKMAVLQKTFDKKSKIFKAYMKLNKKLLERMRVLLIKKLNKELGIETLVAEAHLNKLPDSPSLKWKKLFCSQKNHAPQEEKEKIINYEALFKLDNFRMRLQGMIKEPRVKSTGTLFKKTKELNHVTKAYKGELNLLQSRKAQYQTALICFEDKEKITTEYIQAQLTEIIEADYSDEEKLGALTALSLKCNSCGVNGELDIEHIKQTLALFNQIVNPVKFDSEISTDFIKYIAKLKSCLIGSNMKLLTNLDVSEFIEKIQELKDKFSLTKNDIHIMVGNWITYLDNDKALTIQDYKLLFDNLIFKPRLYHNEENYDKILEEKLQKLILEELKGPISFRDVESLVKTYEKLGLRSEEIFLKILSFYKWKFSSINQCILIMRICNFTKDPMKKNALETRACNKIIELLEKQEKSLTQFLSSLPDTVKLPFKSVEYIIEHLAQTEEELEACQEYMEKYKDAEQIGKLILVDNVFTEHILKNPMRLLRALLNPKSDKDLKGVIFETTLIAIGIHYDFSDSRLTNKKLNEVGGGPNEILNSLYLMDDVQKQALVHMLLVGKNGILSSEKNIAKLIDYFFETFIEEADDETDAIFLHEAKKILKLTISNAKPEDIYFILSNLIHQRLLNAPRNNLWDRVDSVKKHRQDVFEDSRYNNKDTDRKVETLIFGNNKKQEMAKGVAYLFKAKNGKNEKLQKTDAVGLLIEIASSLGSIGVRFLQLMGLYMEVPDKYEDAMDRVYSDIQGQYKLTAYDTIKRCLPAEYLEELNLGNRIGGGSILTVYKFNSKQLKGIVKVVNPNIVGQMKTVFEVLDKTFNQLVEEDRERYEPLLFLLEDVRQWVLADVDISGCVELDKEFRENNSGMVSTSGKFTSSVPRVLHANGKSIIEEEVSGKTLQYLDVDNEEMQEIHQLIRTLLFTQIANGVVHSDIHPGNFTVSDPNILHILDRTLLLKLSPEEQEILIQSALQGSEHGMINHFIQKLLELSVNDHVDESVKLEIVAFTEETVRNESSLLDKAKKVLIFMRKKRVKVTFNLMMSLKNILAIETMIAKAK